MNDDGTKNRSARILKAAREARALTPDQEAGLWSARIDYLGWRAARPDPAAV